MKRSLRAMFAALSIVSLVSAGLAFSDDHAREDKKAAAKSGRASIPTQTLRGELTDATCYLNIGRHGEAHAECAAKCLKNGYPMAILTAEESLVLLVPEKGSEKVYKDAQKLGAKQVVVTGIPSEKGGMKALALQSVKEIEGKDSKGKESKMTTTPPKPEDR